MQVFDEWIVVIYAEALLATRLLEDFILLVLFISAILHKRYHILVKVACRVDREGSFRVLISTLIALALQRLFV